jgi:hypothetical protein
LDEEGSSHIALVNLGNAPAESDAEPHFVFLNKDTSFSEYFSILTGDGSPLNWMYLMDRYVCASDKSGWCIYCEKQSDIAVLAVKRALSTSNLPKLRSLLKAETIEAIDELKADPFFNKLVPSWKRGLMAGYGH